MNFLIRGIARSRLAKTQIAFPKVVIEGSGESVRIAHEGGTDVTHPTPAATVPARSPDGASIVVELTAGPPLKQTYVSPEGRRENTYILSEDGKQLTIHVSVTSPRLPAPVEYKLSYRRL